MEEIPAAKKFKHSNLSQSEKIEDKFKNIFGLEARNPVDERFRGLDFAHSPEMLKTFKNTFRLQDFRDHQLEAINANILKENFFVVGDNGAGKSLCYQLPACLSAGVTVVISPLKALNLEQIKELNKLDIEAWTPSDNESERVQNTIYKQLINEDPKIKLLYVTPEKMRNTAWLIKALKSLNGQKLLARFVIDEAQCIIEVGYDFRPNYGTLYELLKEEFREVPIMAVSGRIGLGIQEDILNQLQMTKDQVFTMPFKRSNLKYAVEKRTTKLGDKVCSTWIKKHYPRMAVHMRHSDDSGIVYCWRKVDCNVMASSLKQAGLLACSYHSDMTDEDRESAQNKWNENECKVICATSAAFGMGINKPDVRYVIHSFLPESMEHYHRETGRAGRDGNVSRCILFYSDRDEGLLQEAIKSSTFEAISRDIRNYISSVISNGISSAISSDIISSDIISDISSLISNAIRCDISSVISNAISSDISSDISSVISNAISNINSSVISSDISSDISNTISSDISSVISNAISSDISSDISSVINNAISNINSSVISSDISSDISNTISSDISSVISNAISNINSSVISSDISSDISNTISSAISCINISTLISAIRKGKGSKDRKFRNLGTMIEYCRTQQDCRKIQLLTYFGGEDIEANICLPNSEAICDNCERANAAAAATG